jgi:hypothetical protein
MLDLKDKRLHIAALEARLHLYQLPRTTEIPEELQAPSKEDSFYSITYASDEASVITTVLAISEPVMKLKLDGSIKYEGPWTCLKVNGPMDLSMTGNAIILQSAAFTLESDC